MSQNIFGRDFKMPATDCRVKLTKGEDGSVVLLVNGEPVPLAQSVKIELDAADLIPRVTFTVVATELLVDLANALAGSGKKDQHRYLPDVLKEILDVEYLPTSLFTALADHRSSAQMAAPEEQQFWWSEVQVVIGTALLTSPEDKAVTEASRIFQGRD